MTTTMATTVPTIGWEELVLLRIVEVAIFLLLAYILCCFFSPSWKEGLAKLAERTAEWAVTELTARSRAQRAAGEAWGKAYKENGGSMGEGRRRRYELMYPPALKDGYRDDNSVMTMDHPTGDIPMAQEA